MKRTRCAFLGTGNMGGALIRGAVRSGAVSAKDLSAFDVQKRALSRLAGDTGIRPAASAVRAVRGAGYVFLCVKPGQVAQVLGDISGTLERGQCLVSIAAGVPTDRIEKHFPGRRMAVVRVMPNSPALVGQGAAAVCGGRFASPAQVRFVKDFFGSVGTAVVLAERHFDAVTAVSGSGPAYVFYLAEALGRAAEVLGLPASEAADLVRQTIFGAGTMLARGGLPAEPRRQVTSPGGTTEAAVRQLAKSGWTEDLVRAVRKARDRSREISRG